MGGFMSSLVKIFFRQVDVVGSFRIPESGPVIFVANHSNQSVDPMMLSSCVNRPVRYLCAAKSMKRPIIGHLARAAHAISVERPQDLAAKGRGAISVESGGTQLFGSGTAFCSELHPGCKVKAGDLEVTVKSVEKDDACTVTPANVAVSKSGYKVLPKVDQGDTFTAVHDALKAGDCIGIFPEGGSTDRTQLLELKPGVAIMALGAMAAGAAPVQIVPCGITYFEPHRFRSRATVEIGAPITVPAELAARYQKDKRGATGEVMSMVQDALNAVVPQAADYKELQALITMKALYKPRDHKLSPEESLQLTKRFTSAASTLKTDERMQQVIHLVQEYNAMLRAAGMRDRDVRRSAAGRNFTLRALGALLQVIILVPFALPAFIAFLPVAIVTTLLAEKERKKALAGSTVKVKALDVVASYKIMVSLVFVPVYNLLIAMGITWFIGLGIWFLLLSYFVLQPVVEYGLIFLCDHFVRCAKHCAAIAHFGCSCAGTARSLRRLEERRSELQKQVRALVEEVGPQIQKDFEEVRVINRNSLKREVEAIGDNEETSAHILDAGGLMEMLRPGQGQDSKAPLLEQA